MDDAIESLNAEGSVETGMICGSITDAELGILANGCPALRRLDLWGCSHVTDMGVARIATGAPKLRILNLGRLTMLTDGGLESLIKASPGLQSLDVSGCIRLTSVTVVDVLENCPNLQALHLGGVRDLTGVGLNFSPGCARKLRAINMCGCTHMKDGFMDQLTLAAPNLLLFDLSFCRDLTDEGIAFLAERDTGLAAINLSGCTGITDASIKSLAKGCSLQAVSLGQTCVTNEGVAELLGSCELAFLSLKDCYNLTDQSLEAIASKSSSLLNLDLENADLENEEMKGQYSDGALIKVVNTCNSLQGFNVGGRTVTDDLVTALAKSCTELMHVALHHTKITTQGVQALLGGPSSEHLECLDLEGCVGIDSDKLMELGEFQKIEDQLKAFVLPDGHAVENPEIITLKKQLAMGVPQVYQNTKLGQSGAETLMEQIWSWTSQ